MTGLLPMSRQMELIIKDCFLPAEDFDGLNSESSSLKHTIWRRRQGLKGHFFDVNGLNCSPE
jgi:hypothetical protein